MRDNMDKMTPRDYLFGFIFLAVVYPLGYFWVTSPAWLPEDIVGMILAVTIIVGGMIIYIAGMVAFGFVILSVLMGTPRLILPFVLYVVVMHYYVLPDFYK